MRSEHWAWIFACVVACGGPLDPAPAIPADQLADSVADAFCSSIEGCCGAAGFPYDPMACRRAQASSLAPYLDGIRMAAGVRYDGQAAFQCVQAMRTRACSFYASIGDGPCDQMFVGLRKAGESCSRNGECARPSEGEAACEPAQNGSICTVQPDPFTAMRGRSGDPCFASCMQWSYAGQPAGACGDGAHLSGAPCYWNDGLYCNFATATCTPLEPLGASCGDVFSCVSGSYCKEDSSSHGVCTAEPGLGGDCSTVGTACGDSLYCDRQVCRSKKMIGEACGSSDECVDTPCDEGKCAVRAPVLASVCAGLR